LVEIRLWAVKNRQPDLWLAGDEVGVLHRSAAEGCQDGVEALEEAYHPRAGELSEPAHATPLDPSRADLPRARHLVRDVLDHRRLQARLRHPVAVAARRPQRR